MRSRLLLAAALAVACYEAALTLSHASPSLSRRLSRPLRGPSPSFVACRAFPLLVGRADVLLQVRRWRNDRRQASSLPAALAVAAPVILPSGGWALELPTDGGLDSDVVRVGSDLILKVDPVAAIPVGVMVILVVPLIWRTWGAVAAKEARLRAAILQKACIARYDASPSDPRCLRELRTAEAEVKTCAKTEEEARSLRVIGAVVARLEVLDTVDSVALEDELAGLPPRKGGGLTTAQIASTIVQIVLLVPTLALLLTDPIGGRLQ